MRLKYYLKFIHWFLVEFSYRFWMVKKRSDGPNMTLDEYIGGLEND